MENEAVESMYIRRNLGVLDFMKKSDFIAEETRLMTSVEFTFVFAFGRADPLVERFLEYRGS